MHKVSGFIMFRDAPLIELACKSILTYVDDLVLLDRSATSTDFPSKANEKVNYEHIPQEGEYCGPYFEDQRWRHYCMDRCKHDMVLNIDGDEILDDLDSDYFRNVDSGVFFQVLNIYDIEHYVIKNMQTEFTDWWPDWKIRFWDRRIYRYNDLHMHSFLVTQDGENAFTHAFRNNPRLEENPPAIWHLHVYARPERRSFFLNHPDWFVLKEIERKKPALLSSI